MLVLEAFQIRCFFKSQKPNFKIKDRQTQFMQPHCPILQTKQPQTKFYMKSVQFDPAHQVLDDINLADTFAWNSLIRYHLRNGEPDNAISIYRQMLLRGAIPDKYTYPPVLEASLDCEGPFYGRQIHAHALKRGFGFDGYVITGLMTMYGQFDQYDVAHSVFNKMPGKNAVAWTLLVALYIMAGRPSVALDMFMSMVDSGIKVDMLAMLTAIDACVDLKSLFKGRQMHEIARKNGLEFNLEISNSLLKMYLVCGSIEEARAFFDQMPVKDAISWTAIISGYVQNGGFNEGLKLLQTMHLEGAESDSFVISSVLPACARINAHKSGKEIHAYVIRNGIELTAALQNALMDMYVKAGFLELAAKIFARMADKDVVSWTVMISGYSLHGHGELGVDLFHQMEQQSEIEPDQTAYVAALYACNTACLVEEGVKYFNYIRDPRPEHYALMVSLLSRAGFFDEARAFIDMHKLGRHIEVVRAMLDGCRIHKNLRMGKRVAEQLIHLDSLNADNYVMLSNVYAANEEWEKADAVREMIADMGLTTNPAYSWIEVRNRTHAFEVGDASHPRSRKIYWQIKVLTEKMKKEGYVFGGDDFALHDVDEERESVPHWHSEMLAIAFGLISTEEGTTVRVTKNHRVCRNCHAYAKMISKMFEREIVLKDPYRFHHFKKGLCSCRDNW